jgi:hypothetical protein
MTQVIIYNQDNGVVAVIIPTPEALALYGIQAIAIKDVPAGKPFKIVDAADIPSDRSERNAWTVDEADLTDGIGGESNEFEEAADIPFSPIVDANGNQFISTTSLLSHCVQEAA